VNRALGFTKKTFDGVIPEPDAYDEKDREAEGKIKSLSSDLHSLMEQNHLDRALKKIMEFSTYFNQYFQHKEPWKKGLGTNTCVYMSVNAVRSISIALYPFLPKSSEKIWQQLGLSGKVTDNQWGSISEVSVKPSHKLGDISPLFTRVEDEDIKKRKEKFETK
jgi:methionyl-tRNA synthetase